MKKIIIFITATLSLATFVYADICSDISRNYNQMILTLQNDTNAALSLASDPAQMDAIRQSYQMQLAQLQSQMQSSLISAGCVSATPPPTTPPPGPGTPPPDPGTPPPSIDPGTPPGDPGNTPPPGDTGGSGCREQLKSYMDQLKMQGVKGRDMVTRLRARAIELGCTSHREHCDRDERGDHDGNHQNNDGGNCQKGERTERRDSDRPVIRVVTRDCDRDEQHSRGRNRGRGGRD